MSAEIMIRTTPTLRLGRRRRHRLTLSIHRWLLPLNHAGRGDHREIEACRARYHSSSRPPWSRCLFAVPAGASTAPAPQAAHAQQPRSSRSASRQEIDSLNPFIAIVPDGHRILRTEFDVPHGLQPAGPDAASPASRRAGRRRRTSSPGRSTSARARSGPTASRSPPRTPRSPTTRCMTDETAQDGERQLRPTFESVDRDRRPHAGDQDEGAAGDDARAGHPDRARARLVEGVPTSAPTPEFPMVGSGPYTVTEFKEAQFVKLKANKATGAARPRSTSCTSSTTSNPDAAVQRAAERRRSTWSTG